jgi:hypothetical protein
MKTDTGRILSAAEIEDLVDPKAESVDEEDAVDQPDEMWRLVSVVDLARALDFEDNSCGRLDCGVHLDEALAHEDGYARLGASLFWRLPFESAGITKPCVRAELTHALDFVDNSAADGSSGISAALSHPDAYARLAALLFAHLPD